MNTVTINIFDSYSAMTAEQKEAVLSRILIDELYQEDEFKVRLEELLTTEQDDALLSRIIEMLGGCLADAEFRNKLTVITGKYQKNSLSYNAVRELMITAFFVNSEEVKSWGAAQLKEKENMDPNNETKLVNYLKNILNDFNLPMRLRWQAALAMANHGTPDAIDALIAFAQYLRERLPKKQTDDYHDSENQFLAEKIAYCIGFAADKMQLTQLNKAAEIFMELHNMIDESSQIQWAIERIGIFRKPKPAISDFVQQIQWAIERIGIISKPKPAISDFVRWIRSNETLIITKQEPVFSPDTRTIQAPAFTDYYHKLLIKSDDSFQEYDLKKEAVIIGRSADCDIPVADNTVSGQHAVIWDRGNECVLKDMDSKNHTYLYDYDTKEWKPCYQRQLQKFDKIKIGSAVFMFIPAKSAFSREEILQKFGDEPPGMNSAVKKILTALLMICFLALISIIFLFFQQK